MSNARMIRAIEERERQTGERMKGRPTIWPDLAPFWAAFFDLSARRYADGGAIPGVEYEAFFRREMIDDPEEQGLFYRVLDKMDRAYREAVNEMRENQRLEAERGSRSRRGGR